MTLTLENISFEYMPGLPVIQNISATFLAGQFYTILGPNGSGKTTLLDLISGFLKPGAGKIRIDGHPMGRFSQKRLAKHIALVSQEIDINFPFTVMEVVMMGRHPYIRRFGAPMPADIEKAEKCMELCGILEFKDRVVTQLSGGERQRCILARALCQDTPILLLDEAFSNMDICHTLDLLRQIKTLCRKNQKTVISVFHDLNLASAWADELLMIKNGSVLFSGPSQTVLTRKSIETVFNVSAEVSHNPAIKAKQVTYPIP